jgi:hypothetical protein
MHVLFYMASHFNADMIGPQLERMQYHIDAGDKVTVLACHKELSNCNINANQSHLTCAICKSNLLSGLKALRGAYELRSFESVLPLAQTNLYLELMDVSDLDLFKAIQWEHFDIGMACTSSLNTILRDPTPDLALHQQLVQSIWESAIWTYQVVKKYCSEHRLDAVYVFNGRTATLRACLRACQSKGIDCFILEAGNRPEVYSIYKNALPHNIDYVVGKIKDNWESYEGNRQKDAESYFERRSQGKDPLNGRFSLHQISGELPKNWNPEKRNISIFVSSEDEFASIGSEWSNPLFSSQIDGISAILETFKEDANFHFYVRIHPNLYGIDNDSTRAMHRLRYQHCTVLPARDPVNSYALLQASEKVITFGSSIGIEAAAKGTISILIANCFYSSLGSTYNPTSIDELVALIRHADLAPLDATGALQYGLYLANFGMPYHHYQIEDYFSGQLNGRKVRPALPFYWLRLLGRFIRLRQQTKTRARNQQKLDKLLNSSPPTVHH